MRPEYDSYGIEREVSLLRGEIRELQQKVRNLESVQQKMQQKMHNLESKVEQLSRSCNYQTSQKISIDCDNEVDWTGGRQTKGNKPVRRVTVHLPKPQFENLSVQVEEEDVKKICAKCRAQIIAEMSENPAKETVLMKNLITQVFEKMLAEVVRVCVSSVTEQTEALLKEYTDSLLKYRSQLSDSINALKNNIGSDVIIDVENKSISTYKYGEAKNLSSRLQADIEGELSSIVEKNNEKFISYIKRTGEIAEEKQKLLDGMFVLEADFWENIQQFFADYHSVVESNEDDRLRLRQWIISALDAIGVFVYDREQTDKVAMLDNIGEFFLPAQEGETLIDTPAICIKKKGMISCLKKGMFEKDGVYNFPN